MLRFFACRAKKPFRRINDLITPKFHEKMFKVSSNDEFNIAK